MASSISVLSGSNDKIKITLFSSTKLYDVANRACQQLMKQWWPLLFLTFEEAIKKYKIIELGEMYKAAEEMKEVYDDPKLGKEQKWMRYAVNSAFLAARGKKIWSELNKVPPRELIYLTVLISAIKTTRVALQLSCRDTWDKESYCEFISTLASNSAEIGSHIFHTAPDLLTDRMKAILQYSKHAYYASQILTVNNWRMWGFYLDKVREILGCPSNNASISLNGANDPSSDHISDPTEHSLTETEKEQIREFIEDLADLKESLTNLLYSDNKKTKKILERIECIINELTDKIDDDSTNNTRKEKSENEVEIFDPDLDVSIEQQVQKIVEDFDHLYSIQQEDYSDLLEDFSDSYTLCADLIHKMSGIDEEPFFNAHLDVSREEQLQKIRGESYGKLDSTPKEKPSVYTATLIPKGYADPITEKKLLRKLMEDLIKLRGDLKSINITLAPKQKEKATMIMKRIQYVIDELSDKLNDDTTDNTRKEKSEHEVEIFDPDLELSIEEQIQKIDEELDDLKGSLSPPQQKKLKNIIDFAKNIYSSNAELLSRMSVDYFSIYESFDHPI
ncbi:MAG: hypothetical protein JSS10_01710 [Verrucomicrobia bacterium]|nr:hypothetical protein [Verrucomicrobiota bacterium]